MRVLGAGRAGGNRPEREAADNSAAGEAVPEAPEIRGLESAGGQVGLPPCHLLFGHWLILHPGGERFHLPQVLLDGSGLPFLL